MSMKQRTFSERSLHGRVAHELGKRIVGSTIKPGETLPNEASICQELDVSRTALREAFKVLTAKGLLESKPKVGTRVKPRNEWNMLDPDILAWSFETSPSEQLVNDLFEVRQIFEPNAAAMAANRRSDEQMKDIEDAYFGMETAEVGTEAMFTTDIKFHLSILEATNNEFMISLGMMIETALLGSFKLSSTMPDRYVDALPGHKAVYMGIKEQNPDAAKHEMEKLLSQSVNDAMDKVISEKASHQEEPEA